MRVHACVYLCVDKHKAVGVHSLHTVHHMCCVVIYCNWVQVVGWAG